MATRLHIEEPWRSALAAIGLTTLKGFLRDAAGSPVAVHADGDVLRLRLEVDGIPRELYLKRTRRHRRRYHLRRLRSGRLPAGRPRDEFINAGKLADAGLPAARAVGYGLSTRWLLPHQGFVLLEALPGRQNLYQALEAAVDATARPGLARRRALLRELGELIRGLHDRRLRWPDASAGHLIVDDAPSLPPATPRLHMLSLAEVHAAGSAGTRRRDLIRMIKSLPLERMARTDLIRLAHAYSGVSGLTREAKRAALTARLGWGGRILKRLSERRGDTGGDPAGRYIRVRGVTLDDRFITVFRNQGFKSFDSVFAYQPAPPPRDHWHQQMDMEVTGVDGGPVRLRLHRFQRPPLREQWRRIRSGRPGRGSAWRLWQQALAEAAQDPAAARPVAFGEKMRGWIERRGFVLLEQPAKATAPSDRTVPVTPLPSIRK